MAAILNIRQATIARVEKWNDLILSTLRSYVEAKGGKLSLTIEFPDQPPVVLKGHGDTEQPPSHLDLELGTSSR